MACVFYLLKTTGYHLRRARDAMGRSRERRASGRAGLLLPIFACLFTFFLIIILSLRRKGVHVSSAAKEAKARPR